MPEIPTVRTHLMGLAELFDEPQHLNGPDAQRCSAADHPAEWMELTVGWSRVLGAIRVIQSRHLSDSGDPMLSMCADSARESAVSELRWCWARLVHQYVDGLSADA